MRVCYTFPVISKMRIAETGAFAVADWSMQFLTDSKTGFVNKMIVEKGGIPRKFWPEYEIFEGNTASEDGEQLWPTCTLIEEDVNSQKFAFTADRYTYKLQWNPFFYQIIRELVNFESYLSLYGLEEIRFFEHSEKWTPEENDEDVEIIKENSYADNSNKSTLWSHLKKPTDHDLLMWCGASHRDHCRDDLSMALAHYRMGQSFAFKFQYIEAIRHLYLAVERLFANGEFKKQQTIRTFEQSALLVSLINMMFFDPDNPHPRFESLVAKHKVLKNSRSARSFLEFMYNLRGQLQHAPAPPRSNWHPSLQEGYKDEAICLMNLVELIVHSMASVQFKEYVKGIRDIQMHTSEIPDEDQT